MAFYLISKLAQIFSLRREQFGLSTPERKSMRSRKREREREKAGEKISGKTTLHSLGVGVRGCTDVF